MSVFFNHLVEHYRTQAERYRQRPFLLAAMGACAYVATSSGAVSLAQRMRVDQVLESLDALQVFDPHEGVEVFDAFIETLSTSAATGEQQVRQAIDDEVAREPDKAELLIRICLAVSDGGTGVPAAERKRIESLCAQLGVKPEVCDPVSPPRS